MRLLLTSLLSISLLLSCQQKPDMLIQGVWHYVDTNPPKPTITKMTEQTESGAIRVIDLEKSAPDLEELHFFLTFKDGQLTQNKFGLKLTTTFKLEDNIILLDDEPFFKILKLTKDVLKVQRIDSGNATTYNKVESDSALLKMAE